ncbi:MAG: hypothetical protein R6X31_05335 [Anaerolineae bacterium]
MKEKVLFVAIVMAVVVLASCGPFPDVQQSEPQLDFTVAMQVHSAQELHISLGVRNAGDRTFEGDDSFNGEMEMRCVPSGELRASAQVVPLGALAPDETAWPLDWHGQLDAGPYELTWGAEGYGSTTEEFAIVEKDGRLTFQGTPLATRESDPSSSEGRDALVALAVSDLQRHLEVEAERIEVKSVEPKEFSDASLGVPEPGRSYAQVIVPGYVIRLEANGEVYEYHAAGERVVLVPKAAEEGPSGEPVTSYQTVTVSEIGLTFEAPAAWGRLGPEFVWTPEEGSGQRLGFEWMTLEPPTEAEAAMLPQPAQIVDSAPVDLGWAGGRRFTLEVYAPATQDGDDAQAPVESVETHVVITVDQDGERLGLHFYASAPSAQALSNLEPALQHMLDTALVVEDAQRFAPTGDIQTDDWQIFEDEEYGFQLRIPSDWTYKEMETKGPGVPEDWPLEQSVAFFPQAWAERFEQSGPPDPNAPPAIPVPSVEVYVGSMEQFRRAIMEPTASEELEIHGTEAVREVEVVDNERQLIRYVFQHPGRKDVRIVLVDALTGFKDRVEANGEVAELLSHVVATFEFLE